jgi:hypothetical protein
MHWFACAAQMTRPRSIRLVEAQASGIARADRACRNAGTAPLLFAIGPSRFSTIALRGQPLPSSNTSCRSSTTWSYQGTARGSTLRPSCLDPRRTTRRAATGNDREDRGPNATDRQRAGAPRITRCRITRRTPTSRSRPRSLGPRNTRRIPTRHQGWPHRIDNRRSPRPDPRLPTHRSRPPSRETATRLTRGVEHCSRSERMAAATMTTRERLARTGRHPRLGRRQELRIHRPHRRSVRLRCRPHFDRIPVDVGPTRHDITRGATMSCSHCSSRRLTAGSPQRGLGPGDPASTSQQARRRHRRRADPSTRG